MVNQSKTAPLGAVFLCVGALVCRVNVSAEDEEAHREVLKDEVYYHRSRLNDIFVDRACGLREDGCPPCGKRRENQVEQGDLQHGDGYVVRRVKGEIAVQSEVPKHRE